MPPKYVFLEFSLASLKKQHPASSPYNKTAQPEKQNKLPGPLPCKKKRGSRVFKAHRSGKKKVHGLPHGRSHSPEAEGAPRQGRLVHAPGGHGLRSSDFSCHPQRTLCGIPGIREPTDVLEEILSSRQASNKVCGSTPCCRSKAPMTTSTVLTDACPSNS